MLVKYNEAPGSLIDLEDRSAIQNDILEWLFGTIIILFPESFSKLQAISPRIYKCF